MRELIVDNFAGGGGASAGIEMALGRSVDIAINHDPAAIAMHKANHPGTRHYCESVWDIDPREACGGKPVGLAWFSPDCKHFSKAKGGKPVDKNIRGLAWVAVRWAATVRPRVIILENVEEFKTWGPVIDGQPDITRRGRTFNSFVNALRRHGYAVDWRELRACDYGAPTIRKRFFLIARCEGQPITWPEPTHGDPKCPAVQAGHLKPWVPAAAIIDWSLPCPSIFERRRPLADATLRRIARGIMRFVVENPEPFIVKANHGGSDFQGQSIHDPMQTLTSKTGYGLVSPILTQYHGEKTPGEVRGQPVNAPIQTIDAANRYGLVAAFLTKYYGGYYTGAGSDLTEPLHTVTANDHHALITSHIVKLKGTNIGQQMTMPLQTVTAGGNHFGEVRAFLIKYYGQGFGQSVMEPLHTVTSKDTFGLVTVKGERYAIADIGLRMLEPRELFNAQGFPGDYIIHKDAYGREYPKYAQVARCGNAVPPPLAEALVRANMPELRMREAG